MAPQPNPLRMRKAPGFRRVVRILGRSPFGRTLSRVLLGCEHHSWGSVTRCAPALRVVNFARRKIAKATRSVGRAIVRITENYIDAPTPVPAPTLAWHHMTYATSALAAQTREGICEGTWDKTFTLVGCASSQPLFEALGPYELLALRAVNKQSREAAEHEGLWRKLCLRRLPGIADATLTEQEAATISTCGLNSFDWRAFYWQYWRLLSVEKSMYLRGPGSQEPLRELPSWLKQKHPMWLKEWVCVELFRKEDRFSPSSKLELVRRAVILKDDLTRPAPQDVHEHERRLMLHERGRICLPISRDLTPQSNGGDLLLRVFAQSHGRLVPVMRTTVCDPFRTSLRPEGQIRTNAAQLGGLAGGIGIKVEFDVAAPIYKCTARVLPVHHTPLELTNFSIYATKSKFEHATYSEAFLGRYSPGSLHLHEFFQMIDGVDSRFECSVCLDDGFGAGAWSCARCESHAHSTRSRACRVSPVPCRVFLAVRTHILAFTSRVQAKSAFTSAAGASCSSPSAPTAACHLATRRATTRTRTRTRARQAMGMRTRRPARRTRTRR
jgi:hypothetical protein